MKNKLSNNTLTENQIRLLMLRKWRGQVHVEIGSQDEADCIALGMSAVEDERGWDSVAYN